jgi:hypothetical protein
MPPLYSNLHLSDLRSKLRRALLDLVDPYTWDDDTLSVCIQQASLEHSYQFPALAARRFTVTEGLQTFDVTAMVLQEPETDTGTAANSEVLVVTRVELPAAPPPSTEMPMSTTP